MEIKTTKDIYFHNGDYDELRKNLHNKIIDKFISEKGENPEIIGPEAIILGGGSGSGKTSVVEDIIGSDGYVIVDADKIKEELDEFKEEVKKKNPLAADIVHDESSDIATFLLDVTMDMPENLIYDGTMKNIEKYKRIIDTLKRYGYTINMVIVDADVEVAVERVKVRNTEGRFVSEDTVRLTNKLISESFKVLKDLVDSYTIYENSVNGEYPREIAYKDPEEDDEVIIDMQAFINFLEKSNF
ncbi:TPA: zeta toxin family protein [Bacillus cereus]|uniref:zeta toxin family protein n=1 Tax=Bacillus thuringiensis TaxID=1428 RepID=UPI000BF8DA7F|nr:zeta toxin family protein [Bacillus thuringiensis]PFA06429.1 hypothetical protein CN379_15300 [Bacillus thuringiensis]PFU01389.1 hypothetical protein COK75_17745 [Bacillus thuringiensis]